MWYPSLHGESLVSFSFVFSCALFCLECFAQLCFSIILFSCIDQAPEVLAAGSYDAKADIWSIGCIFFEMLAGEYPFNGVNEADLLNNIRTKDLRTPPDVSSVSVSILRKVCLSQYPVLCLLLQLACFISLVSCWKRTSTCAPRFTT